MSAAETCLMVVAGIGGGLTGSVAGLASLATYPALLAIGLAPVTANVTNTVSLVFSTMGSVSASRPELRGQGATLRRLAIAGALGGAAGGALLLVTPSDAFELVVPWLVAFGSLSMLARRRLVRAPEGGVHRHGHGPVAGVGLVGVYGGYFGAGAGVMLLALLLHATDEDLPRANAMKNVVLGVANGVAAVAFALFGPVQWSAVLPLGAGLFIGGRLGPVIVRRLPADGLRIAIAVAGLGLAVKLALDAYT
jgi:uncharacterized membrane protein YfcA